MEQNSKKYFLPGDIVTIRQAIPHKPEMVVIRKVVRTIKTETIKGDYFQGILCRWFTTSGELQEAIFNTKDLISVNYE